MKKFSLADGPSASSLGGGGSSGLRLGPSAKGLAGGVPSKRKRSKPATPAPTALQVLEETDAAVRELAAPETPDEELAIAKRQKDEAARRSLVADSHFWFAVCFETNDQKMQFLRETGFDQHDATPGGPGNKYLNGLALAEKLGVKLETRATWPTKTNTSARLKKLAKD